MRENITVSVGLLLSGLLLLGCGVTRPPKQLDEVKLQLKWVHQAQFAGFYVAQEKGYYAKEGINVTFLEGGQAVDIARTVISGQADFGVLTPEFIFLSRSKGAPLTAVAAIYRRSAVVFVSTAESGIVRPSDFVGKTVAARNPGGFQESEIQFNAMMKKVGVDFSRIKIVPYDSTYAEFYNGNVNVTSCYSTTGLVKIRQKGVRLNLIWPSDYGIHFYSDTLVTADKLISEKPDLVTRFLRASIKGWQEAVEDLQEAVTVTLKYAEVKDPGLQMTMMEAMLPLVYTGEDKIGWMKEEIWQGMYRILSEQKLVSKSFDVSQAYTLRFLNEIYGGKAK
jgi:NitT/TauT family transport system substrate-binding protein